MSSKNLWGEKEGDFRQLKGEFNPGQE